MQWKWDVNYLEEEFDWNTPRHISSGAQIGIDQCNWHSSFIAAQSQDDRISSTGTLCRHRAILWALCTLQTFQNVHYLQNHSQKCAPYYRQNMQNLILYKIINRANGIGNTIKWYLTKSVFITLDLWSDSKFLTSLEAFGVAGLWRVLQKRAKPTSVISQWPCAAAIIGL